MSDKPTLTIRRRYNLRNGRSYWIARCSVCGQEVKVFIQSFAGVKGKRCDKCGTLYHNEDLKGYRGEPGE